MQIIKYINDWVNQLESIYLGEGNQNDQTAQQGWQEAVSDIKKSLTVIKGHIEQLTKIKPSTSLLKQLNLTQSCNSLLSQFSSNICKKQA
jgi:hypothetical protein